MERARSILLFLRSELFLLLYLLLKLLFLLATDEGGALGACRLRELYT